MTRRYVRRLTWRAWLFDDTRVLPWPIPDRWAREWERRRYLRSLGVSIVLFEEIAVATLISFGLVLLGLGAVSLWSKL